MNIGKTPETVWKEYQKGTQYKQAIELYDTVEENENFFIGKQWEGLNAPDLQKPVLNILKRPIAYYVATIGSDDIGTSMESFDDDEQAETLMRVFAKDIDRIIERDKTKAKLRDVLRNAAVDGDGCLYFYFDSDVETGQAAKGDVASEVVENINVIFGNPYEPEVQRQPYIIIALRKPVDEVIDEARENGCEDADAIIPDSDENQGEKGDGNELCTVLIKLWKQDGKLRAIKTTERCTVREEWEPGNALYPVAWMQWDKVRKSYHGMAAVTGLVPNQIAVNKLFAMFIRSVELNAFPKIVYNADKLRDGWNNRVGEAIGCHGDVNELAVNVLRGGDVSAQVMDVIDSCVSMTRDCIGATDAALGNVNPDNTSAIVATQQASAIPLELQRRAYFDFVEQCVRIILDLMCAHYGERRVRVELPAEEQPQPGMDAYSEEPATQLQTVDYGVIRDIVQKLNVSVGSSAYWSELMQMQTMDNLLQSGIINDAVLYLESVPDKWLPNKQKIIDSARSMQQQQLAGAMPMELGGGGETPPEYYDEMLA